MFTEYAIRSRIDSICRSDAPGVARARQLLKLSKKVLRSAVHLMDVGFVELRQGNRDRCRRFWAASANLFGLANQARAHAKHALHHKGPRPCFDYTAREYAVPAWERDSQRVRSPKEVLA